MAAAAAILYDAMLHGVKWDCQSNLYPSHPVRLELRRKYFRENFRKFETAYFLNISTPAKNICLRKYKKQHVRLSSNYYSPETIQ